MNLRTMARVCLWSTAIVAVFTILGAAPICAGDKKSAVYHLDSVEVQRGYFNFAKEAKILSRKDDEVIKKNPIKLESAATGLFFYRTGYAHKVLVTIDAPPTVQEGQEFTVSATTEAIFELQQAVTDINFSMYVTASARGSAKNNNRFASDAKPVPAGATSLKVTSSNVVNFGKTSFLVGYSNVKGARYATVRMDGGSSGPSGQLTMTIYVAYRQELQEKKPVPMPTPKTGQMNVTVKGGKTAGEILTVTATIRSAPQGETLRLQLPAGVELLNGQEMIKLKAGNSQISWNIRAAKPGGYDFRLLLGSSIQTNRIDIVPAGNRIAKLPELPEKVRQRIEQLRQQARTKNSTFQIGQTGVSQYSLDRLCGFRVPAGIDFPEFVRRINFQGNQWWQAELRARAEFNRLRPNLLPELQIDARNQVNAYKKKSRFDWRDYGKVPPVRMQDQCGSCWDFAGMGAFESSYLIRNNKEIRGSEQQVLDCVNSTPGGCDGGWYMDAFKYLIDHGGCPGPSYPYAAAKGPCRPVSSPFKAVSYGFVATDGRTPTVDAMKAALCEHGPIVCCVCCTDAFQHYSGGVFNEFSSDTQHLHAVVIVGWDDTKGKNGCWAMRNSWDTNWGEQGYMWIEYGCNGIGDFAVWVEAQNEKYAVMSLAMQDYRVKQGTEIFAPISLLNPTNVNNMDWDVQFDSTVAQLMEPSVLDGSIPLLAFRANPRQANQILFGFTEHKPINTGGQLARIHFKAVGAPGTRTPLTLVLNTISDPNLQHPPIRLVHGSIQIVKQDDLQRMRGSCCGQPKLVIEDAICALEMSVKLRDPDPIMDMNNDGKINSDDAAIIVRFVMGDTLTGQ